MKITPLIIGIFTGAAMIILFLWLYSSNQPANSPFQYFLDIFYAGGIAWTLIRYVKTPNVPITFKAIFGQGFRCFIIVTFMMVAFTAIFYNAHPEISKEAAANYREWSLVNEKDILPPDRDKAVASYERKYVTTTVGVSVFAFLLRGLIFTAAGAVVALMRRKQ
jgi:hypothetical protein